MCSHPNVAHPISDYLHHRYILYEPGKRGWTQKLKIDLRESIKAALDGSSSRDRMLVWPKGAKISRSSQWPERRHCL